MGRIGGGWGMGRSTRWWYEQTRRKGKGKKNSSKPKIIKTGTPSLPLEWPRTIWEKKKKLATVT
jgi:hypothetical protein